MGGQWEKPGAIAPEKTSRTTFKGTNPIVWKKVSWFFAEIQSYKDTRGQGKLRIS